MCKAKFPLSLYNARQNDILHHSIAHTTAMSHTSPTLLTCEHADGCDKPVDLSYSLIHCIEHAIAPVAPLVVEPRKLTIDMLFPKTGRLMQAYADRYPELVTGCGLPQMKDLEKVRCMAIDCLNAKVEGDELCEDHLDKKESENGNFPESILDSSDEKSEVTAMDVPKTRDQLVQKRVRESEEGLRWWKRREAITEAAISQHRKNMERSIHLLTCAKLKMRWVKTELAHREASLELAGASVEKRRRLENTQRRADAARTLYTTMCRAGDKEAAKEV